jgi:autotransporter-associated beta strand protein
MGGVSGVIAGTGTLTVSDLGQAYWDPSYTVSTGGGGTGNWDNISTNWYNGSSDAVWPSGGAFANFGTSAGTVTLNATVNAAGLAFTIAGYTISGSPTLDLIDSADISVPSGTTTINCPLGGTTGLTETGSGTLSLGGVETYTGATTIGVGSSLIIADPGDLGSGAYADNITNNGTFTYNSSVPQTLSGTISGAGLFNQSGSGTLTLTANSSYAGPLVISAGSTLTIGNGGGWATNSTAGGWITNNGSLVYDSTSTTLTNGDRIRGVLGTLTLSDGSLTLTMSDTCTGLTTINPGCTLIMGGSGSSLASAVTNSGSFINSSSVWISSGGISGPGTVTVSGGKLTFSGANTYTGNTTVSGGTLSLTNGGSIIASPNIIVANGATFDVSGLLNTNTVVNLFTNICLLASGQTLSNSSPTAILAGSINSGLGTISLTYASGTPSFAVTNGTLTLSPSTTFNVNNTGPSALGPGTYTLIGTEVGGVVAGTVPSSYTVGGYGVSGTSSLIISTSNTLDLVVVSSSPVVSPIISGPSVKVTVNGNPTFSGNSGSPNCIYGVESTTSLSGTPVWIEATNVVATPGVPGVTTGSDGSWSFTDANQTNPPTIFYRLYNPDDPTSPPQ